MTHPRITPAPVVVEVNVSRGSQQALTVAVSEALRLHACLVLQHTTELGLRAYGNHLLSRASAYARRRGMSRSLIVRRVVTRTDRLASPGSPEPRHPAREAAEPVPGTSEQLDPTPRQSGLPTS